jgi:hypothetical protein
VDYWVFSLVFIWKDDGFLGAFCLVMKEMEVIFESL